MKQLRLLLALFMALLVALPALADIAPLPVNRGGTGATSLDGAGILTKTGAQTATGDKTLTGHTTLGLTDITGTLTAAAATFSGAVTAASFTGNGAGLTSLNASNLATGTLPGARFPASLPAVDGSALTGLTAGQVAWTALAPKLVWVGPASGPNAPPSFRALVATDLPGGAIVNSFNTRTGDVLLGATDVNAALGYTAADAANLNASALTSGTVPDARFPATLPALSGANLTSLNASNLATGTVSAVLLPGGSIVNSFNTRTGAVTLASGDVTTALGFTPVNLAGDTMTGTLTVNKTAQAGVAEEAARFTTSDAGTAYLSIQNGSSGDSTWITNLLAVAGTSGVPLSVTSQNSSDTGSNPLMVLRSRIGSNTAATVRPLVSVQDNATDVLQLLPLNGGANGCITFPAGSGTGAPTFTNRSIGTRYIIYQNLSTTATDFALGVEAGGPYLTTGQAAATSQINFYGGTTKIATFQGNGLADHSGTVRATGNGGPSAGVGAALDYGSIANTGRLFVYDYTAAAYKNVQIEGLAIKLAPNGTTALTADTTGITMANSAYIDGFTSGKYLSLRSGFAPTASGGIGLGPIDVSLDGNKDGLGVYGHDGVQVFVAQTARVQVDTNRTTFFHGIAEKLAAIVGAGPTTAAATDRWISLNPTVSATQTVNLPASPTAGQRIGIIDAKGIAASFTITVSGNGNNINVPGGAASASTTITTNYGSLDLIWNGAAWSVVSKVGALPDFLARLTPAWVSREAAAA